MTKHVEDGWELGQSVKNFYRIYAVAFDKAEELLRSREPKFGDGRSKEEYWASLPALAVEMAHYFLGEANMLYQTPEKDLDQHHLKVEELLVAISKGSFYEGGPRAE